MFYNQNIEIGPELQIDTLEDATKQNETYLQKQQTYLNAVHPTLDPAKKKIDLSEDFVDKVKIKWSGTHEGKMTGVIEINKQAIKDKLFLEWLQNRELYNIWEKEQEKKKK